MGSKDISIIIEVCDGMLHLEPPPINHKSARSVNTFTHGSVAGYMDQELAGLCIDWDVVNTSLGYLGIESASALIEAARWGLDNTCTIFSTPAFPRTGATKDGLHYLLLLEPVSYHALLISLKQVYMWTMG